MKFPLRYWTRRSATTISTPVMREVSAMFDAASVLRKRAAGHDWDVLGEAFLREEPDGATVMHLPVLAAVDSPGHDLRLGQISYGPVVAAIDVAPGEARDVMGAMLAELSSAAVVAGPAEFHFDPAVGRTDGLVVIPVDRHPTDKAAYITAPRVVAG